MSKELPGKVRIQETKDEHRSLKDLVHSFEKAAQELDLKTLCQRADQVYWHFMKHAYAEELSGGFFSEVLDREPRLLSTIKRLREEHDKILSTLSVIRHGEDLNAEELVPIVKQFSALFHSHEQLEEKLIDEHFFQDLGEGA